MLGFLERDCFYHNVKLIFLFNIFWTASGRSEWKSWLLILWDHGNCWFMNLSRRLLLLFEKNFFSMKQTDVRHSHLPSYPVYLKTVMNFCSLKEDKPLFWLVSLVISVCNTVSPFSIAISNFGVCIEGTAVYFKSQYNPSSTVIFKGPKNEEIYTILWYCFFIY